MKKRNSIKRAVAEREFPELDFSKGARGKYAAAMKKNGYTIRVDRADGSIEEKQDKQQRAQKSAQLFRGSFCFASCDFA